jgi:hypothetical protein
MSLDHFQFETLLSNISAQLIAVSADQLEGTIISAPDSVRCFFKADRIPGREPTPRTSKVCLLRQMTSISHSFIPG